MGGGWVVSHPDVVGDREFDGRDYHQFSEILDRREEVVSTKMDDVDIFGASSKSI